MSWVQFRMKMVITLNDNKDNYCTKMGTANGNQKRDGWIERGRWINKELIFWHEGTFQRAVAVTVTKEYDNCFGYLLPRPRRTFRPSYEKMYQTRTNFGSKPRTTNPQNKIPLSSELFPTQPFNNNLFSEVEICPRDDCHVRTNTTDDHVLTLRRNPDNCWMCEILLTSPTVSV